MYNSRVCFYTPAVINIIEYPHERLSPVRIPPSYNEAEQTYNNVIYTTYRPAQNSFEANHLDFSQRVEIGQIGPYWTTEKKHRAVLITGLVLSILTAPLLFPLIPAFFCGRALKRSFQKGDLDCEADRIKIREKINNNRITLSQIVKRYGFDAVNKYRLLDHLPCLANSPQNEAHARDVYERYRQLEQNVKLIKNTHHLHKRQIKKVRKEAVGNVIASYRWRVAFIVVKQALFCLGHALLAALSAQNDTRSRRNNTAGIQLALGIEHGIETVNDLSEWDQISREYDEKVGPWDQWQNHKIKNLKVAYRDGKTNLQHFFAEIHQLAPQERIQPAFQILPSAPPLIQPSAPPLDFVDMAIIPAVNNRKIIAPLYEQINNKICPCDPITCEPIPSDLAVSLDCNHVFSRPSIEQWLKTEKKDTCPLCRAPAKLEDLQPVPETDLRPPEDLARSNLSGQA